MRSAGDETLPSGSVRCLRNRLYHRIEVTGAKPGVHLGNQGGEFGSIALAEAAEGEKMPGFPYAAPSGLFQEGVDAFFLCITDEAAGIHEQVIDRTRPVFRKYFKTILRQLGEQVLGVDCILGASEGYYLDAFHHAPASSLLSSSSSTKSREANSLISLYHSRILRMWET